MSNEDNVTAEVTPGQQPETQQETSTPEVAKEAALAPEQPQQISATELPPSVVVSDVLSSNVLPVVPQTIIADQPEPHPVDQTLAVQEPTPTIAEAPQQPVIEHTVVVDDAVSECVDIEVFATNTYVDSLTLLVPIPTLVVDSIRCVLKSLYEKGLLNPQGYLIPEEPDHADGETPAPKAAPLEWFLVTIASMDLAQTQYYFQLRIQPTLALCDMRFLSCSDPESIILKTAQEAVRLLDEAARSVNQFIPQIVTNAFDDPGTVLVSDLTVRARLDVPWRNGSIVRPLHTAADALNTPLLNGGTILVAEKFTGWSRTSGLDANEILTLRRHRNQNLHTELMFRSPVDPMDEDAKLEVDVRLTGAYFRALIGGGATNPFPTLESLLLDADLFDSDEYRAGLVTRVIEDCGITEAVGFPNVFAWEENKEGPFRPFTMETARRLGSKAAALEYKEKLDIARSHIIDWTNSAVTVPPSVSIVAAKLKQAFGFNFGHPPAFYACIVDFYLKKQYTVDDVVSALIAQDPDSLPRPREFRPCSDRAQQLAKQLRTVHFVDLSDKVAGQDLDDIDASVVDTSHTEAPIMATSHATTAVDSAPRSLNDSNTQTDSRGEDDWLPD